MEVRRESNNTQSHNQGSIYAATICDYIRHGNELHTETSHDNRVQLQSTWNSMCNIREHLSAMYYILSAICNITLQPYMPVAI